MSERCISPIPPFHAATLGPVCTPDRRAGAVYILTEGGCRLPHGQSRRRWTDTPAPPWPSGRACRSRHGPTGRPHSPAPPLLRQRSDSLGVAGGRSVPLASRDVNVAWAGSRPVTVVEPALGDALDAGPLRLACRHGGGVRSAGGSGSARGSREPCTSGHGPTAMDAGCGRSVEIGGMRPTHQRLDSSPLACRRSRGPGVRTYPGLR